ncbi:MAG: glycosyltransferase [Proteobacteria bacterium]|jgi:GT2 family glycosyltransferase|nr:glycosyltransferase [Pseudomonadota bacterium]
MDNQVTPAAAKSIDVVIPVYNAPGLTRRCIDSVVTHLGQSIQRVLIQDDASGRETREMLDHLPYAGVEVCHAEKNQGFGLTVNAAVNRSNAFYVLILNSDTEVNQNILPQLCAAFDADDKLAAIIPAGNSYDNFDFSRYVLREGNYVQTYYLRGHAILIRRDAFLAVGGFDATFGRGYYEDIDLGRRLDLNGWRFGVHPEAHIYHKGAGSFGDDRVTLARRNRAVYLSRYPKAQQNIMLLSGNCALADFSDDLLKAIDQVFHVGGSVHWFTPLQPTRLICLQMYGHALRLHSVINVLSRGWQRADRRVTAIWIMPGVSFLLRGLLTVWARWQNLKILFIEETVAHDPVRNSE